MRAIPLPSAERRPAVWCAPSPAARPAEGLGLGSAGGKATKQVTGPTAGVEYSPWHWNAGQGQVRHAVGDLMMHPAPPALVIALRTLAERRDVAITGHT